MSNFPQLEQAGLGLGELTVREQSLADRSLQVQVAQRLSQVVVYLPCQPVPLFQGRQMTHLLVQPGVLNRHHDLIGQAGEEPNVISQEATALARHYPHQPQQSPTAP